LNIVEVKVFSDGVDVAPDGTATQSSTYQSNDARYGPGNSVDNSGSYSNTANTGAPAWWEVSLASAVSVESIEIDNKKCRSFVCACHMSDANLILYDANDNPVYTKNLGDTCNLETITEAVTC
jgi:hypothetical protein